VVTMRGGPRLMCSPYLTGSLAIMLCLATFNYWTASSESGELGGRLADMQHQLQAGSKHISSLEDEIRTLRNEGKKCKENVANLMNLKKEVEEKFMKEEQLRKDVDHLMETTEKEKAELETKLRALNAESEDKEKERLERREKDSETIDNLTGELEQARENVTRCEAELLEERAARLAQGRGVPQPAPGRHLAPAPSGQLPGQLPDLNPAAVNVVQKDKHGAGLTILDPAGKVVPPDPAGKVVPPDPASSSSRSGLLQAAVPLQPRQPSPPPGPPLQEQAALPQPDIGHKGEEVKQAENLDNAEDDSQIAEHANGDDGKEEIQDDDQNPDGQIDVNGEKGEGEEIEEKAAIGKIKQEKEYLLDKANENIVSPVKSDADDDVHNLADNLDTLRESLNQEDGNNLSDN